MSEQTNMITHLNRVVDCATIEEVWKLHTERMAAFGFSRLLYGYTSYRTGNSFGDRGDMLILSNHHPDYVKKFIDDQLYFHAPMVRWAAENVGACSWSWMRDNMDALSSSERKVLEFNKMMGVVAGYSISFRDTSPRAKGAIALTAPEDTSQSEVDAYWETHGDEITVLNKVAHLKITTLPRATHSRSLTKRQREVLEWVGDGKTMQDIAILMDLTPATVEKHLRLAREALDVETTAQAVLKASVNRQIFVVEP